MTETGWNPRPSVVAGQPRAGTAAAPAAVILDLPVLDPAPAPSGSILRAGEALTLAGIGLWTCDPANGRLDMTDRARELLGLAGRHAPLRWPDRMRLIHPGDRPRVKAAFDRAVRTNQGWDIEYRVRRPKQAVAWVSERTSVEVGADGRSVRIHGVCQDVTDRRQATEAVAAERDRLREELDHHESHDPLTGLPNRRRFIAQLERALEDLGPSASLAVLSVDLDNFKLINDSLGHGVGDRMLSAAARRLDAAIGGDGVAARFGGDQFALLCDRLDQGDLAEQLATMADRVLQAVAEPVRLEGHAPIVVTASLGIAVGRPGVVSADDLVRDADSALHRAKEEGRGRFSVFDEQLRRRASLRLSLGSELRDAVGNHELFLEYQPQFRVADGELVGVEALVRWQHPTRGLLAPGEWIPVAEETELIVPVGEWVLAEACQAAAAWMDMGGGHPGRPPLKVCVNVSAVQLARPELIDAVVKALDTSGIDPACLCVEITESVLMGAPGMYLEALLGLKLLGISIAVDDFGTGYSSLAYLRRFPIDVIKIDRGFVDGLHRSDQRGLSIMRAVIQLSEALGVTPVAEGVETAEQAEILGEAGCYAAQGFLYSRPLPAEGITRVLRDRPGH